MTRPPAFSCSLARQPAARPTPSSTQLHTWAHTRKAGANDDLLLCRLFRAASLLPFTWVTYRVKFHCQPPAPSGCSIECNHIKEFHIHAFYLCGIALPFEAAAACHWVLGGRRRVADGIRRSSCSAARTISSVAPGYGGSFSFRIKLSSKGGICFEGLIKQPLNFIIPLYTFSQRIW